MSSLAQDELGHAAALYGLLGELTGDRPRRARLRPRAGRIPPLPAARPRPGRLGDDDRPPLPVRQRRRGPARCARRRRPGRRSPSSSGSSSARSAITGCTPRRGSTASRGATASHANGCWRRSRAGPDAATVFTPLPDEPELIAAGILDAPMSELEARWRASIAPLLRGVRSPDAAARPRPDPRAARPWRAVPLAVGRVHLGPPRRPRSDLVSEAGTQIGIARLRAGVTAPTPADPTPTAAADRPRRGPPRAGRGDGPGAPDAVRGRPRDRPPARGRRPRRRHPGRDPADVRRLPRARAHQRRSRNGLPRSAGRSR